MFKTFLLNLISNATQVSSKRFSAIILVVTLISSSYIATFTIYKMPQEMFDTLAILAGSLFGGTVVESLIKKTKRNEQGTTANTTSAGSSETIPTNTNANTSEEIIG